MPQLAVNIAGLRFKNPLMLASGTCGYGLEYAPYIDLNQLGGVVVKGVSLEPRAGNPPPRIIETPAGMLNAIGLQNIGHKRFVKEFLPVLRAYDLNIIVNIYGHSIEEYAEVAKRLSAYDGISALEINVSCPNVTQGGLVFGSDPLMTYDVVYAVKQVTRLPVITKLSPNVTDIKLIAKSAEDAGSDALSLINTLLGMKVDIIRRRPSLANITGGLSGPAIRPVALRMVWETVNTVNIPVIGIGGIMGFEDALEFFIVGAKGIQVGTALFVDSASPAKIIEGLKSYLIKNGFDSILDIIGTLKVGDENET